MKAIRERVVGLTEILVAFAGTAFTAWAGVVLFVSRRVVSAQDNLQTTFGRLSERLTRVETLVAPGIPPPPVADALDDHENRLRALESRIADA